MCAGTELVVRITIALAEYATLCLFFQAPIGE
jgi:hypothetical protein